MTDEKFSASIDFRLLSGVEAFRAGTAVALGPARPRAVLAALLWEVNVPVSLGELATRVWGEDPPRQASSTLHSYFTRLRAALSGDADIVRLGHGYALEADPLAVDLNRFHDLATRARAERSPRAALPLFEQALELWRGEPFAGLDSPWLNGARMALEVEHEELLLDRTDLLLELGEHASLLPELAARARRQPLNERVAGQLMVALYRSGRQADALLGFRTVKSALAQELGINPGPSLRALYQAILTEDSALAIPPHPDDVGGPAIEIVRTEPDPPRFAPRQLPASPRSFVGRDTELRAMSAKLGMDEVQDGSRAHVVVLAGPPGVGKTSLALRWAHGHGDRFPDGRLFVDLRGFDATGERVSPYNGMRAVLLALGVTAETLEADREVLTGIYRTELAGKRLMLVVDNAVDVEDVLPLLPGTGGCAVIVTSRNRMPGLVAGHNADLVVVDMLSARQARELLRSRLGHDRLRAEPEAVEEMLAACGGLPLALSITVCRAQEHPDFSLASLAAELDNAASTLNALDVDAGFSMRTVLATSYRALAPDQAEAFAMLGYAPGADIGVAASAALIGRSRNATRALLRALERYCLIEEYRPGRFRFHDLVKAYAHQQAQARLAQAGQSAGIDRLIWFYLRTLIRAAGVLDPERPQITLEPSPCDGEPLPLADSRAAIAWFELEADNVAAAQRFAQRNSAHLTVWQFGWGAANLHAALGWHQQKIVSMEAALAAAETMDDGEKIAFAHRALADPYTRIAEHGQALHHAQ